MTFTLCLIARLPESEELKRARAELARAQASVNELESQAWEKRGGLGRSQKQPFMYHGLLIGLSVGSLLGYAVKRSTAQHHVVFPIPFVGLMLVSAFFAAWLIRFIIKEPRMREELNRYPKVFRSMKLAFFTGAVVGLLGGLLLYVFVL